MKISALSLAMSVLLAAPVLAAEAPTPGCCEITETCGSCNCCGRCGCHDPCCKVCTVVPTVKEVKTYVWVVKCEDYCRPLPAGGLLCRDPGCCDSGCCKDGGCAKACDGCCKDGCCKSGCDPCAAELSKCQHAPHCGSVHCKKILEKKQIVCKVPTFKCVVTYCCSACGAESGTQAPTPAPTQAPIPAPAPAPQKLPPAPRSTGVAPMPAEVGTL